MHKKPLISILITTYRAEDTIVETLDSIYEQTCKDFEIIIVDDGSDDNTAATIKSWKRNKEHVDIIFFEPGRVGRSKALNYGVSKAKAQWIAICDADDLWHSQKLERQVQAINKYEVDVLGTYTLLGSKAPVFSRLAPEKEVSIAYLSKKKICISNQLSHSSVMIRKELCKYDESRKSQLDYALWLKLFSEDYKLANIEEKLTFHRIHDQQNFEGKMGKGYRMRSFRLKATYALKNKSMMCLVVISAKLLFDLTLPRSIRNGILAPFR